MPDIEIPKLTASLRVGQSFVVSRAVTGPDARQVLVKTVAPTAVWADAVARLDNEFNITRGINHPGLHLALDRLDTRHGPMLVFADNGLAALDEPEALPLDPAALLTVGRRVATALAALHGAGIIHRDVNPSNIVGNADLSQVRLIDFCTAIRADDLERERPGAFAARGTLGYLAPEQSGRMNRSVDHRADLYSLGVTLYELGTGLCPFDGTDAAGVIHRHLTEMPDPPHTLNPAIAAPLSDAIMRLMAKNPGDRFHSAEDFLGALSDGDGGRVSSKLKLPDRLYGRDDLLASLSRTVTAGARGRSHLYRVVGPSGAGKSALIAQLIKPSVAAGAQFIQGKFDQLDRARPYGAFVQAFDMLLRRLLAGTPDEVETWRARLLDALSPNAQILLDVMPGFVKLLGPQPPVPELGLNEAQIRMSLVFRRFVGTFAREEAPLVIFLDDLQWSDGASRALIELLMSDTELRHLTILTAYRDNEVGPGHPATLLFSALDDRVGLPAEISVGPLEPEHVAELVGDCLGEDARTVAPLAQIIVRKTAGNPFFIRQFLLALVRKGLVRHDPESGRWTWDTDLPAAEKFTSNVADLVIERILALPQETQKMLQLAACNGNIFETSVLALAAGRDSVDVVRLLEPAIVGDVVLVADAASDGRIRRYRFQHDRVQQAAYQILSVDHRSVLHARLGGILLQKNPETTGRLIEITDHLIAGRDNLEPDMRDRLRDLALDAARLSKAANAYDAALRYLEAAEQTLDGRGWENAPALAFDIGLERAEAAYLQGRTDLAEDIANGLLKHDLTPLDEVRVLELMILLHTSELNYLKALAVGKRALALLGESLPLRPGLPRVAAELAATKLRLTGVSDADLLALPRMQDPHKLAAMRVLVLLAPPAYFSAANLLPVIALRMVRLSVRYGNAPDSAYGYVIYGMLHCAVLNDPERGLAYGELARTAAVELGAQSIEGRVLMVFGGFIRHWSAPLRDTLPVFLEGADKAISVGDLEYHGYTRYAHASYALMGGQALPKVTEYLGQHLAAVTDARHEKTKRIMTMARESVMRMRGLPAQSGNDAFDEAENFQLWTEQKDATSLAYLHKYKLLEALMVGDYSEVLIRADAMTENLNGILSMAFQPFYQFYEALALIEQSHGAGYSARHNMLLRARRLTRRMERWATHAPASFGHRAQLLRAELDRVAKRYDRAITGFDRAIAAAREAGALHDVGLFLERSALAYLALGPRDVAASQLTAAMAAHEVWGAKGWSAALESRYPNLVGWVPMQTGTLGRTGSISGDAVDSVTLIRAAAGLAQQTSLEDVIKEMMRAIVVNVGAVRGAMLLDDDASLMMAAEMDADGQVHMMPPSPVAEADNLPQTVLNFVRNSGERVVLDDATRDPTFGTDPYIVAERPFSVLCVPLVSKGTVVGVIYLENANLRGAFTPDRCRTVEVLGAQAAVSVENARLFDRLRGALERQVDLTSAHARFVPHTFLEMLGRPSIADVRLGDHVRGKASILFSDIRGFTSLLEQLEPDAAIEFINAYLSRMEPAVQAGGGFVDSYIGDAVMAVFDRGAEAAIEAAIAMTRALRDWQGFAARNQGEPIKVGIGIATGELIFGTIGAANRLKCGVIGDTVNLAARIEGLTKQYGASLLITDETYRTLPDPGVFQIREIDFVTVVGRATPVRLYEVCDADPEPLRRQKRDTAPGIARGLTLYRSGEIARALECFEICREQAPDDPLAPLLIARCLRDRERATGPDWDGIERITRK